MFKKLLITGGCGFIGTNFIRYLLDQGAGYEIINLDKLTYAGVRENLADLEGSENYRFVQGDICDAKKVNELIPQVDLVMNFAAESHVDRSIESAAEFVRTNFVGTQVLLDACVQFEKPFFQVSTDEVYGSALFGAPSFAEEAKLDPSSPYSASKAAAELLCLAYKKTHGLKVKISRSSNNFGPYQFPEKFIPVIVSKALKNEKIPVYGQGLNMRDWIFVEDNCSALEKVLQEGAWGEAYNIGVGHELHNIDLVKIILQKLNKPENLIEFVVDRKGHDLRYAISTDKIRALGWKPTYSFEDGMQKTIEWYQQNADWLEKRLKK